MSGLFQMIQNGGLFFMLPIVATFILLVVLFVMALTRKNDPKRTITLLSSISLFILIWGIFGQVIGLISAFDAIEAAGEVSPAILAGGLKISFLPTTFGMFTFLIGRLAIIILQWRSKE